MDATPDVTGATVHIVDFLLSLGPAGIVAAVMWLWKEREAKRADSLQDRFNKAIDKALAEHED